MSNQRTEQFLKAIDGVVDRQTIKRIGDINRLDSVQKKRADIGSTFKNEIAAIEKICHQELVYLDECYGTDNALKNALTGYRNALRGIDKDHPAIFFLRLTKERSQRIRQEYNSQVSTRQRNIRIIESPEDYILFAESLLTNTSYIDRLLALAALTGRRTSELLCTAKFKPLEEFAVLFEGQLKTKGRDDVRPYEIPLLSDSTTIIEALERLQSEKPELWENPTLAKNRTGKPITQKMRKLFPEFLGENPIGRDLRRAYGAISWHFADKKHEITKQKYISDILGHGVDDNLTGGSYMDYIVKD
jgi:integrase